MGCEQIQNSMTFPSIQEIDKDQKEDCFQYIVSGCGSSYSSSNSSGSKSVSFGSSQTIEIDVIKDRYSRKVWYSKKELEYLQYLQQKECRIVGKFEREHSDAYVGEKNKTLRGIEHLLINDENQKERARLRSKSLRAVLYEQKRQKQAGLHDPIMVAKYYRLNGATKSQQAAFDLGLQDADTAQKLHNEHKEEKSIKSLFRKISQKGLLKDIHCSITKKTRNGQNLCINKSRQASNYSQ